MDGLEPLSLDDVISKLEEKSGEKASDSSDAVNPISLDDATKILADKQ